MVLEHVCLMEQAKSQKTAALLAQSSFSLIWSLLYENLLRQEHGAHTKDRNLTATRNMAGFIQKNYPRKLSLRDIALSGAVGQNKCCKLFAKYFGKSPTQRRKEYLHEHH